MSNLILAARMRNEGMPKWVADQITLALRQNLGRRSIDASILVMGITFKEDVPDIRNSKVVPMIKKLEKYS
jgi:UDP-N-acetyl-D-galactosamine dehydrogenase